MAASHLRLRAPSVRSSNGVNASAADRHDAEVAPVSSSMSLLPMSFDQRFSLSYMLVTSRYSRNNRFITLHSHPEPGIWRILLMKTMNAARTMTYLRPNYVRPCTFVPPCQHLRSSMCAVQSNYTPRRLIATTRTTTVEKPGRLLLDRQHHQHQRQIVSHRSYATMPTPTASRVAVIGAGTVGATIAFSLIGMLVS
jgi:hypothetical protein